MLVWVIMRGFIFFMGYFMPLSGRGSREHDSLEEFGRFIVRRRDFFLKFYISAGGKWVVE